MNGRTVKMINRLAGARQLPRGLLKKQWKNLDPKTRGERRAVFEKVFPR
jgi:hypothetical protein